ncbi:MAG: glycosyltransferase family 2 protein [Acidobacteriota bacterium]
MATPSNPSTPAGSSSVFLAVAIPTFNRAPLLAELLGQCADELEAAPGLVAKVGFYILDNASTDRTPEVVAEFRRRVPQVPVEGLRRPENLGIRINVLDAYRRAQGRFRWVIGDDEILHRGCLPRVVEALETHDPGLTVAFPSGYPLGFGAGRFENLQAFVRRAAAANPHALGEHTLCSCNIVREDCYDPAWAEENIEMFYGQMFGAMRPLHRAGAPVLVPDFPVISLRGDDAAGSESADGDGARTEPADGRWADVDACWIHYLSWLRDEVDVPELDPHAPSKRAQREMWTAIRRSPLAFLARHRKALLSPSAYKFGLRRLLGLGR